MQSTLLKLVSLWILRNIWSEEKIVLHLASWGGPQGYSSKIFRSTNEKQNPLKLDTDASASAFNSQ